MMTANDFGNSTAFMLMDDDAHRLKKEREAALTPPEPKPVDPDYKSWQHHTHTLECYFNWHARIGNDVLAVVDYTEREGPRRVGKQIHVGLRHNQSVPPELRDLFRKNDAHLSAVLNLRKPFSQAHGDPGLLPHGVEKALRTAMFERVLPTLGFWDRMRLRNPERRESYQSDLNVYKPPMPIFDLWFL